jgi:hypothetical protein
MPLGTIARDALLGVALTLVALAAWHGYRGLGGSGTAPAADVVTAPMRMPQPQAQVVAQTPPATPAPLPHACAFEPLVPVTQAADGQFALRTPAAADHDLPAASAYVDVAREATRDGRWRDAEVALITACRIAAASAPGDSVPVTDIRMQLAQLYGAVPAAAGIAGLQDRQRQLVADSVTAYSAALGRQASKTQLARSWATRLAAGEVAQAPAGTALPPAAIARAEPRPARPERAAAAAPQPAARSPELTQLDADLQRLQAQARAVSADPEGMRRRTEAAESRRRACSDDACLRRWYAARRAQLLDEF